MQEPAIAKEPTVAKGGGAVDSFEAKKALTIECLRREYDSFFNPMEMEFYNPDVTFEDPMISLSGPQAYKQNVEMLAGTNPFGRLLFSDCGLTMHNVTEGPTPQQLETRWTLQFRFNLLPWAPVAQFTGVSKYTLDSEARVLRQQDFWDSVNLGPGGEYGARPKTAAFADLLQQLAPKKAGAEAASDKELPYVLLRRTAEYEVRRYPVHVSICTAYERRIDAFGTLGAYTNGANDALTPLKAYVPSLMSVPYPEGPPDIDGETPRTDNSPPKMMRWPMSVPALKDPTPPQVGERYRNNCDLQVVPSKVVAVLPFADPTTERTVRGYAALLRQKLDRDGLRVVASQVGDAEEFRLAQFDALNSFGARRSEVWFELGEHPW